MNNVRIPQLVSLEKAINIYYHYNELSSKEIAELFGGKCCATIQKLKNKARAEAEAEGKPIFNAANVNTEAAYKAWGLDINDLETRYKKLKELDLD